MIYLDNSATTPLAPEVLSEMSRIWSSPGNPSSLHSAGQNARRELERAKSSILSSASLSPGAFLPVFTGSGSEANNLAIRGCANAKTHFESKRILISDSEHPSLTRVAESLTSCGFEIVKIPTRGGALDLEVLELEARRGVFLFSSMLVNNETGAIYDIKSAAELIKSIAPLAIVHCDATQGFMRIPLPKTPSVDLITASAHKIHGPAGVGVLFVRRELIKRHAISPIILGGSQEEGMRAGTENLAGIVGFAKAAELLASHFEENFTHLCSLSEYAVERVTAAGARVNMPKTKAPHILSVTLPRIKSQTMLNLLSAGGVCVSSGSACSSRSKNVSPSLRAFGLTDMEADSTIRISFSVNNQKSDIDALGELLAGGIARLVKIK